MPARPFGLPIYSIQSRFVVEMMILKAARESAVANSDVLQRVQEVFITCLYGHIPGEGRNRPLIRLSIVEIETLLFIALDICADHPHDPDAAQKELETRLQRKNPGATIFGLVAGDRMETLGSDIIMFGRNLPTDPEACLSPAISIHLVGSDGRSVVVDDDYDDLVDEDFPFMTVLVDDQE